MSPEEHHEKAEQLLKRADGLLAASADPDAAGEDIRKAWHEEAMDLLMIAAVHATFSSGGEKK